MATAAFFMDYANEIIRVLTEAGDEGLKADKISRHVFNACNSMFAPEDYERVHQYVRQYLHRNASMVRYPFIERVGWGRYRLDRQALRSSQLSFRFADLPPADDVAASREDHSLSLFPIEEE